MYLHNIFTFKDYDKCIKGREVIMVIKDERENKNEGAVINDSGAVGYEEHKGHSCCGGKDGQLNMKKHFLHMILCCGIPIVILLMLPFIARVSPWGAGILGLIAPFICPLMMGGMVFMMFRNTKK